MRRVPRQARLVVPEAAHHVTQRGTGRQLVFLTRGDRQTYLRLLKENSRRAGLRILAYCLMPNHIHLVCVPGEGRSMAVALLRVHGRYAQYFNARKLRSGHLWQNRFYSCPMDEQHLWTAVRYVELNPVRAGLVREAGEYEWSSAAAHLGGEDRRHVLDMGFWAECGGEERWRELLAVEDEDGELGRLRRSTYAGNPLGAKDFVERTAALRRELMDGLRSGAPGEFGFGCERVLAAG